MKEKCIDKVFIIILFMLHSTCLFANKQNDDTIYVFNEKYEGIIWCPQCSRHALLLYLKDCVPCSSRLLQSLQNFRLTGVFDVFAYNAQAANLLLRPNKQSCTVLCRLQVFPKTTLNHLSHCCP